LSLYILPPDGHPSLRKKSDWQACENTNPWFPDSVGQSPWPPGFFIACMSAPEAQSAVPDWHGRTPCTLGTRWFPKDDGPFIKYLLW